MPSTLPVLSNPWLDSLKGLLFPPVCLICNRTMGISSSDCICATCRPSLMTSSRPGRSGFSLFDEKYAAEGGAAPDPLDAFVFLYHYGPSAKKFVHRIKMTQPPQAEAWLASELQRSVPVKTGLRFDAVIPVPSHRRGTLLQPQAGACLLWAEALASFFGAPVVPALARTRTVPKQTTLRRARRLAASESSLAVRGANSLRGRSVILADDVMTTGATARACARMLKRQGVERVAFAAIARG